jgi:hypothetical protein
MTRTGSGSAMRSCYGIRSSVSDPYSSLVPFKGPKKSDPDPAFKAEYGSGSGSRVLMTKNLKKNLQLYIFFIYQKPQFTYH